MQSHDHNWSLPLTRMHVHVQMFTCRGGRATSKGHQQKGHFLEKKGAPTVGNLKAKIYHFLDIGIYPYIVITLSGMISIFVSLHTSYKISLKHHTLQLGVMSEYAFTSERSERETFLKICEVAVRKITSYKEEKSQS